MTPDRACLVTVVGKLLYQVHLTFLSPPPALCFALSKEPIRDSTFQSNLFVSIWVSKDETSQMFD